MPGSDKADKYLEKAQSILRFFSAKNAAVSSEISCPQCNSQSVKILSKEKKTNKTIYHWQCLICGHEFSDEADSGSLRDKDLFSIQTWLQCWYLYGLTSSFNFIASKLNLSPQAVEQMVLTLQKIFDVRKPLIRNEKYKDWLKSSGDLTAKLKGSLAKMQKELLSTPNDNQPSDTAQYRHTREIRSEGKITPPSARNKLIK